MIGEFRHFRLLDEAGVRIPVAQMRMKRADEAARRGGARPLLLGLHLPRQRQIGILSEEWHRAQGVELTSARVHPTFFGLGRFWIFAFRLEFCVRRLQSGLERFSMGRSGGNFGRPENGGRRAAKARGRSGALSRVTFQKFCRRRAGLDPGRGRADGMPCMDWTREQLNAGPVAQVIAILEPVRSRRSLHPHLRGHRGPNAMRSLSKRGLPIGSGVVESACKHIVGNRFKKAGCRRSKAGANALLAAKAAWKQPQARNHRLEGLPRRNHLTKKYGMPPSAIIDVKPKPEKASIRGCPKRFHDA